MTNTDSGPSSDDTELPGLAEERTELAWSRSALAAAVTAAAILRREWADAGGATVRRVVTAVLLGALLAWAAWVFLRSSTDRPGVARQQGLRRVAVATIMLALTALALCFDPGTG